MPPYRPPTIPVHTSQVAVVTVNVLYICIMAFPPNVAPVLDYYVPPIIVQVRGHRDRPTAVVGQAHGTAAQGTATVVHEAN